VKTAHDALVSKAQRIGEAIYKSEQSADAPAPTEGETPRPDGEEDVVDAEIVDEDESK
jgi:molecular chaperone DnaK